MRKFLDMELYSIIRRNTFPGWELRPRIINMYELVLIVKGQGAAMIDGQERNISAGDLLFFQPDVEHSMWLTREPYMEFYGLHFFLPDHTDSDAAQVKPLVLKTSSPQTPAKSPKVSEVLPIPEYMRLESPHRLEVLFKNLYDISLQKDYLHEWRQNLLLQQIICEILTLLHAQTEPISVVRMRKVLTYIHEDPCREISLEDLLQQTGIRKTVFLKAFRSMTGTTPIQYITAQRLEKAGTLLLETRLPIAQIGEQCGFSDPFYFSRCFRKHFFQSPSQYRNKIEKENQPI